MVYKYNMNVNVKIAPIIIKLDSRDINQFIFMLYLNNKKTAFYRTDSKR